VDRGATLFAARSLLWPAPINLRLIFLLPQTRLLHFSGQARSKRGGGRHGAPTEPSWALVQVVASTSVV
jgi:hypothetical protein